MCVETLRTGLIFLRQSIWGITCLGLLSKWMFFHLSPWKPINVCWNPQNRAQYSEMMDLRDHMPRFTLKMNVFPSICLETPLMCIETLRTGLVFTRQYIWGITCLGLLSKWMFSHLSPWKPHKCVLKPSEQGLFLQDDWFEGSHV